jgi:hypothetical protein
MGREVALLLLELEPDPELLAAPLEDVEQELARYSGEVSTSPR